MTSTTVDYANYFWGEKHHGYYVLYEHMKHEEDSVQELAQFIKERANFEEECNKFLAKCLTKTSALSTTGGTMSSAWVITKNAIELLNEIQKSLFVNLQQLFKDIMKYHDELIRARKRMKDHDVVDAVSLMQTTTTCLQKAKETYTQRGSEIDRLKKENATSKEMTKAENKLIKSREEYKIYIDKYGRVRDDFEVKMTNATRRFQQHDTEFLQQMKVFLSMFARCIDESASAASNVCAQYRQSVNALNIDDIMVKFVETMVTGTKRPGPIVFEELETVADQGSHENMSVPSSSSNSSTAAQSENAPVASAAINLLNLDVNKTVTCNESCTQKIQPSPVPSDNSTSSAATVSVNNQQQSQSPQQHSQFSASLGRQKLSLWLPGKRKKYASQSSLSASDVPHNEFNHSQSESLGFLRKYRSRHRKSNLDLTTTTTETLTAEDAKSTGSSIKSDERTFTNINGSTNAVNSAESVPPPLPSVPPPTDSDDETEDKNEQTPYLDRSRWSSCTESSDEDEEVLQAAKLRSINIKPLNDSTKKLNPSVDELRDAIGNIVISSGSINRSNTFDSDPWTATTRATPFSMSLGNVRPLRAALTGDDYLRKKRSDSYNGPPLPFSVSMSGTSIARERPHSSTPTPGTSYGAFMYGGQSSSSLAPRTDNHPFDRSESIGSLDRCTSHSSESPFSQMMFNPLRTATTINENRLPVAIAINEYVHAWFKGVDHSNAIVRVFGTVLVSFPASDVPSLTDPNSDIEPLKFTLIDTKKIGTILPNKQLVSKVEDAFAAPHTYTFDRKQLSSWLCDRKNEKPDSQFLNVEVLRYEVKEPEPPPLLITAFWKLETQNTDLRVDYRLNADSRIENALLNVAFTSTVDGSVMSVIADPKAEWLPSANTISWRFTELSRHGDCSGSLKARLSLKNGPANASKTFVHFQTSDASISGVNVVLAVDDLYHLSLIRRKVFSGKYFCDAEIRK